MSDVALMKFKNFYTGMRQDSRKEDAAIPITVRQLESLIRLGEARARTRLSDTVTEEDAEVVLKLFLYCMRSVYTDPESGHIDIDWVVAGTSKTKRDRGKTVREIMTELEKTSGEDIPALEVVTRAEEEGITREKVEEVLEIMKRDGIIFSPTQGIIKFVR
jgi:replicative DNA helicase Mcm